MAKDKGGKQAARITPHPHGADGSCSPSDGSARRDGHAFDVEIVDCH
jgi:hypothetical protein